MKKVGKLVKILGSTAFAVMFLVSMAFAWHHGHSPGPASADASAFVHTEITADQLVYDQVNTEHGLMVSKTKTLNVTESGYGAYHKGPAIDGKGFYSNELGVERTDTLKVAHYTVDVHAQGMSQAMTTAADAGAGASATYGADASASAEGASGGLQYQRTTYDLNGMHGGGIQVMRTTSFVNVSTSAH